MSTKTIEKYQTILKAFFVWVFENGRQKASIRDNIDAYLSELSACKSGRNIATIGNIMKRLLRNSMSVEEREGLSERIKYLRHCANQYNPPDHHPAEPLSWKDLLRMVRRSRIMKLSYNEKLARDVLIVAFSTVSRCAEILALRVSDVSEGGDMIRVRPKTMAGEWGYLHKCVEDLGCVQPSKILSVRRKDAIRNNREHLFATREGEIPASTQQITTALRRLTNKLNLSVHVTAHSARKGAATEALLRGVPLVIIKSWGGWARVDTLEAYLGKTIRERLPVLRTFIKGGSGDTSFELGAQESMLSIN